MMKLGKYLKPYKWYTIFGSFFKFLEVISELLLPMLMVNIINNGVVKGDKEYVIKYGLIMLVMSIAGYAFAFTCQYFAARASQGFGTTLREAMYGHILKIGFKDLDEIGVQKLTVRITNDINQLQVGVAMLIRLVSRAPFICIGAIVMSFMLNVKLALLLLLTIPILSVIIYLIVNKSGPLYSSYQRKIDKIAEQIKETLSGVRVIRSFTKSKYEEEKLNNTNLEIYDDGIKIGKISSLFNPLTSLVINIMTIIILWVSGIEIKIGSISQGEIVAFINYVTQILGAILVLSNLVILLTKSQVSAKRVNEVLDVQKLEVDGLDSRVLRNSDEIVKFNNVSFRYTNNAENVLSNISFGINSGEVIGIIGRTGSGKSTLIQLIPRYYDTSEGEILFKGTNINEISRTSLRENIRVVFQKSLLFSGTIYENLTMGCEEVDESVVMNAIKTAQATDIVNTIEDLNLRVERGGVNFSGGQRQRLAMARALVSKPELLIFDDTTSALDFLTESNFRKSLSEVPWKKTTIIVSQRISSIINADKIIVIEDGEMVGFGPHESLIDSCDIYRELYQSQVNGGGGNDKDTI